MWEAGLLASSSFMQVMLTCSPNDALPCVRIVTDLITNGDGEVTIVKALNKETGASITDRVGLLREWATECVGCLAFEGFLEP